MPVVGVDIYPIALRKAREDYRSAHTHFVAASGTALPFGDGSFANIVTLETIEHITDDTGFLRELARVLRTNGIMVLSTPNQDHSLRHNRVNPFHVREYAQAELVSLLNAYFADVTLYYQGFASTYYAEVATYASSIQAEKKKLPTIVRFLLDNGYIRSRRLSQLS